MEIPPKDFYWERSAYPRDPDGQQVGTYEIKRKGLRTAAAPDECWNFRA
jgi:hypothetical protein